MAHCSYKALLGKVTPSKGTPCGQSEDYPGQLECIALKDCIKDVTGHLKTLNLSADKGLGSEINLLLARAGKYHSKIYFCLFINYIIIVRFSFIIMHLRVVLLLVLKHHSPSRGFLSGRTSLCLEHLSKTEGRFRHPLEDGEDHVYSTQRISGT